MLKSFANEETHDIYHGIHTHAVRKLLPSHLVKVAQRKMDILNCVESLDSLSACLAGAKGDTVFRDAHGKHSILVEGDMRIAFRWDNDNAFDVELKL